MSLNKIIENWLKDTNKTLDISYLGLTEWPKKLLDKCHLIIILICIDNKFKVLPSLPNIEVFYGGNNPLEKLPYAQM